MKILVTAGPTREPIDPVRFLSNRSSGRMGYAVAVECVRRGHVVRLVSGPVSVPAPAGCSVYRVQTAAEMFAAVKRHFRWSDVLVMAAAVADWRPVAFRRHKMKKGADTMVLKLRKTPDILSWAGRHKGTRLLVGFAAETQRLEESARRKLKNKNLDIIVANNVLEAGAGFDVETNRVTVMFSGGRTVKLPLMSKMRVAERIVREIEKISG